MKRNFLCLCILLLAPGGAATADAGDPENLARLFLGFGGDPGEVDYHHRVKMVWGWVMAFSDVEDFAETALGPRWASLDSTGRKELVHVAQRLLADCYARRVPGKAGTSYLLEGRSESPRGPVVRAALHDRGGGERVIEFRFAGGKIVDVSLEGKSIFDECRKDWQRLLTWYTAAELPAPLRLRVPDLDETATGCVKRLQAALIQAMKRADALGYDGRHALLSPVIESTHDLSVIALTTLRRDWKGLSTEQKREFLEVFRALSLSTYAARFEGWSGESFELVAAEDLPRNTKQVKTVIERPGKPAVRLDYVLRERDGRWLIVNVLADGVSDLALKRTEYASVMEREGFPGLMKKLREQIARHQAGAEK